ncbi:MAG: hypothetical protein R3C56_05390 [Pirellulaceae bacterium]
MSIDNARPRTGISLGASQPLYDCVHNGVIEWLGTRSIAAQKWTNDCSIDSPSQPVAKQHRFLCFERRSCGDIVVGDHKVMGSAQRRGRGALLQHGSLLLATSPYAPSLQGLSPTTDLTSQSLLGRFDSPDGSWENLAASFFDHLCHTLSAATGVDLRRVAAIDQTPCPWHWPVSTQFADPQWTHRV